MNSNGGRSVGLMVVQDAKSAGAIAWWRLSGNTTLPKLTEAWAAEGLPANQLPSNPTAVAALRRAAFGWEGRHKLVRPLDHATGRRGWALVEEFPIPLPPEGGQALVTADLQEQFRYQQVAALTLVGGEVVVHPSDYPGASQLRAAFHRHQHELEVNDISVWLTARMKALAAVSLRDTGGVYFVPQPHMDTFHRVCRAVASASAHVIYEVPALHTNEAVSAILAAVDAEAAGEAAAMELELDTGGLGARALQGRVGRCDQIRRKVEMYEELLGRTLDVLKDRLEGLKAGLAATALSNMPEAANA